MSFSSLSKGLALLSHAAMFYKSLTAYTQHQGPTQLLIWNMEAHHKSLGRKNPKSLQAQLCVPLLETLLLRLRKAVDTMDIEDIAAATVDIIVTVRDNDLKMKLLEFLPSAYCKGLHHMTLKQYLEDVNCRLTTSSPQKRSKAASLLESTPHSESVKRQRVPTPSTTNTLNGHDGVALPEHGKCERIYTDGAHKKSSDQAGVGVYFQGDVLPRISRRCPGPKETNVVAEWVAFYDALCAIRDHPHLFADHVTIYNDYKGILLTLVGDEKQPAYMKKWTRNDATGTWWRDGKEKENSRLIDRCFQVFQPLQDRITIAWVKAHTNKKDDNSRGNAIADQLASDACVLETTEIL